VATAKTPGDRAGGARAPRVPTRKVKELTPEEAAQLALKIEVARELGLWEKVQQVGWGGLTAAESGRVGGMMTRKQRQRELEASS
jgi:hypothetical protein